MREGGRLTEVGRHRRTTRYTDAYRPHTSEWNPLMPDENRELLTRFMDSLFRDTARVSRLDAVLRAQTYDLPEILIEIVNNLPPVAYTRHRLADQLNSAIVGHGLSRTYGTVE